MTFLKRSFTGQVLGRGDIKPQYDQNELETYLHYFNKYFAYCKWTYDGVGFFCGNSTFLLIDIGIKECAH